MKEQPLPEPDKGYARVKVRACRICHSDALTKEGAWPGIVYPRCPGHEIAGIIDALGPATDPWKTGDRVGIGWHGGHCGKCESCRRGDFIASAKLQVPGISYDGGYSEYVLVPVESLACIPDELGFEEAAPLLCAGVTTFNALRRSGAQPGDLVAIQGIGGLGHLGLQFASKFGFDTVAIGRGEDKRNLAWKLGSRTYPDARSPDIAKELAAMGGARVILATAPDGKAMEAGRGPRREWQIGYRGHQLRAIRHDIIAIAPGAQVGHGLAGRNVDRFRGRLEVRGSKWGTTDDRNLSAGAGRRCLRAHDIR